MVKSLIFGPILAQMVHIWALKFVGGVLTVLDVKHCCKLLVVAISRKMYDPDLRKWQKTSFWP